MQTAPIFTPDFNNFKTINATKAWSLQLSGCREEDKLGNNPMIGRYLTIGLLAALVASIAEIALFSAS